MLQSVMTEPGKIRFLQIEKPEINDDEVLMQTKQKTGYAGDFGVPQ